jgi:hypothetical protein
MASYAIYDVESLRGDVNNVISQQHAIHAALLTATTQLTALQRATAVNRRALNDIVSNVTELHSFVAIQALALTTTMYCLEASEALSAILQHRIDPALVPLHHLNSGFAAMVSEARHTGLQPVIADPKQVYQLQATFRSLNSSLLQVSVSVPLRPVSPHLDFTLWKYTPLPVPHQGEAALIVAHNDLLAVSSDADVVMSFPAAHLHACNKLGHTYLCHYSGTASTSPSADCLAAIFFQNTAAAAARCQALQIGHSFYAARVTSHSFAVYSPSPVTCIINCQAAATTRTISGYQLVHLDPGCTATVNHYVFAAPQTPLHPHSTMIRGLELNNSAWAAASLPIVPQWLNNSILDLSSQLRAQVHNISDLHLSHGPLEAAVHSLEAGVTHLWHLLSGSGAVLAIVALVVSLACIPGLRAVGARCLAHLAACIGRRCCPAAAPGRCPSPPPSPTAGSDPSSEAPDASGSPASSSDAVTYTVEQRSSPVPSEDAILLPGSPKMPPLAPAAAAELVAAPLPRTLSPDEINALILGQRPTRT